MTWKIWAVMVILAGAGLAYAIGSMPRKHRSLSSMQPGAAPLDRPELGQEAIDTTIVDSVRIKNESLEAQNGAGPFGIFRFLPGTRRATSHMDTASRNHDVEAMRKKYHRN